MLLVPTVAVLIHKDLQLRDVLEDVIPTLRILMELQRTSPIQMKAPRVLTTLLVQLVFHLLPL